MKPMHLYIPCKNVLDAYMYGGNIFAITNDGDLKSLPLTEIFNYIVHDKSLTFRSLLEIALLRNDWFENAQAKNYLRMNELTNTFKNIWDESFSSTIFFNAEYEPWEHLSDLKSLPVYDFIAYAYKLFIGTSKGLFTVPLSFSKSFSPSVISKPHKSFDAKVLNISARSGELAISSGRDGLFHGSLWNDKDITIPDKQYQPISFRTNWTSYDLMNYDSAQNFSYIHNDVQKVNKRPFQYFEADDDNTKMKIIKFASSVTPKEKFLPARIKEVEDIVYVHNSTKSIFIYTSSGKILVSNFVKNFDDYHASRKFYYLNTPEIDKKHAQKIITVLSLPHGNVTEYLECVKATLNGRHIDMLDFPVISTRTFPRSRRYRRISLIVEPEGIHIFSFFPSDYEINLTKKYTSFVSH